MRLTRSHKTLQQREAYTVALTPDILGIRYGIYASHLSLWEAPWAEQRGDVFALFRLLFLG